VEISQHDEEALGLSSVKEEEDDEDGAPPKDPPMGLLARALTMNRVGCRSPSDLATSHSATPPPAKRASVGSERSSCASATPPVPPLDMLPSLMQLPLPRDINDGN
jgi:hypothetical protein